MSEHASREVLDRDDVVRLTVVVQQLVKEVRNLTEKVEEIRDERVVSLEHKIGLLEERLINEGRRLAKIEDNGIWMFRVVVAEGLALVSGGILWALNSLL